MLLSLFSMFLSLICLKGLKVIRLNVFDKWKIFITALYLQ